MNYTKPEVNPLGKAKSVIEKIDNVKLDPPLTDPPINPVVGPAYDLDE